ncbi:hypothetical protein [uncultured Winogradskyella sp.]|uniref:hypothetical protein n=1 Tax=uncultured Winogradskyella sp. TaxID=395353 RepID=UPI002602DE5E|nr:hypothetical protein [uncultured Winogradskyella sp.]
MNKTILNFIATLVLALILSLFLPWWSVMTAALASALFIPLKKFAVFFVPFLAIFLFWSVYSFALSSGNDYTLAKRISQLLYLGSNPYLLIIITGLVGGLAAGTAALLGKQITVVTK